MVGTTKMRIDDRTMRTRGAVADLTRRIEAEPTISAESFSAFVEKIAKKWRFPGPSALLTAIERGAAE